MDKIRIYIALLFCLTLSFILPVQAQDTSGSDSNRYNTQYSYDCMCNITSLSRNGLLDDMSGAYCFYVKDHLGNNRMVVHPSGTVEQVNNYYPYGGLMANSTNHNQQRYKYNGKELDRMHGLDWYDYSARWMDAAIGRWHVMDPLCEKYYDVSPYSYCGGNPINRVDLHGDSIMILDKASIDAIYNALQSETNLSIKFKNGVLIPESISKVTSNSPDAFLHDLYIIATSPQMIEIATTSTNDYYIGDHFFSDSWRAPSDIDYAKEFNNGQESLFFPLGKTICGNLGQTLYPISSGEYKRSANSNI